MKNVYIYSYQSLSYKRNIHRLIKELADRLLFKVNRLECNFVDDIRIKDINKKHLNHDYITDIITFNYSDSLLHLDGEIFISLPEAKRNAKKYKVKFEEELTRLIIHGILHLIGYDDQESNDRKKMKLMENKLLVSLKFILLQQEKK